MPLVTFDFHNTLATCDRWFQLEIAQLASAVYAALLPDTLPPERRVSDDVLQRAYREVRKAVITSGREQDALASVMSAFAMEKIAFDPLRVSETIDRLMHDAASDVAPGPGAPELVRALRDRGYTLGVVSSAVYPPFLEWALESFGIADCFAFVVTSASAGVYKSDPDIYRQALTLAGSPPATAVHIGDSPRWDATTAKVAGMRTILLETNTADRYHDLRPLLPPDLVLESFVDAAPRVVAFLQESLTPVVEGAS